MLLLVILSVFYHANNVSPRVVCRRSEDLAFHCAQIKGIENATVGPTEGGTKLLVIRRFDPSSAYLLCTCPEVASPRFTVAWFIDDCWVARMDGANGEMIEETLDIKDGWDAYVKIHRGVLYVRKLNESATYCLRCVCTAKNHYFVSEPQCIRLEDLNPGTVPHKRDWRFSVVAACFAVAGAFVVAGALLTHLGSRDDVSDSDALELIRNPISVLNLTVVHHELPDSGLLDAPPSSPAIERSRDTHRSRRHTFGCHGPNLSMDGCVRNSI